MTPEEELREKLIGDALKQRIPMAAIDPTSPWMPDLDSAVAEAIKRAQLQNKTETAGVIFQNPDGMYAYSIPLTMKIRDEFALQAQSGKDRKLAAIWHSHPGDTKGDDSTVFSPNDITRADQLKLPSYIQFMVDGKLRSYTPGKTKTFSKYFAGNRVPAKVSLGDDVVLVPRQLMAESTPQ